jgi:hypothetical protein
MQLTNLVIDRIIIHQVFQRDASGEPKRPAQSNEYTNFDTSAMEAFKRRVIDALGEDSRAVQMQISNQEIGYVPRLVEDISEQDNESFVVSSFDFATKLTDAQQKKNIPGGILVVFTGSQGSSNKRFLGLIKAEIHSGYERVNLESGEISLRFVQDLLLTPTSKLYKTAAFFENTQYENDCENLNDKWSVFISDYQIGKADGKAAAKYFYSDFLGFCYPETSARTTKTFYDSARTFISKLNAPESEKSDYLTALHTYLKVDNSGSISTSDFASRYFDVDTQDSFTEHMQTAGVPTSAFAKDIEHISSNLKTRKVNFKSNVKITAPTNVFKDLVEISIVEGEPDETGSLKEWTQVLIKDRIVEQE